MKSLTARAALAFAMLAPFAAWSQVALVISIAPPPLPVYAQPLVPGDGYIWVPGYWTWNAPDSDYYWVPGTWVLAPSVGELWTPGYWALEDSGYRWHGGYWGNSVGYYGDLNYGYGYSGSGYQGGRWAHGVFQYNKAVSHINTNSVHAVYNAPVVNARGTTHVSFIGGASGSKSRPTAAQNQVAAHGGPTAEQVQHEQTALTAPTQRASLSHGAPAVAATPRPSAFTEPGVERVQGKATAHAPPAVAAQRQPAEARTVAPRPELLAHAPAQTTNQPQHSAPQQVEAHAPAQTVTQAQHAAPTQHAEREPSREEAPHGER